MADIGTDDRLSMGSNSGEIDLALLLDAGGVGPVGRAGLLQDAIDGRAPYAVDVADVGGHQRAVLDQSEQEEAGLGLVDGARRFVSTVHGAFSWSNGIVVCLWSVSGSGSAGGAGSIAQRKPCSSAISQRCL